VPYLPGKAKEVTATTDVEFDNDIVAVTYRKKLVRTAAINIFGADPQQQPGQVREALEDIVIEWDVLDDEGEKLPATQDITRKFDFDFLMAIFNGIIAHALPGEVGGATSASTSPATATSASARKSTH
jgi:hypothetical protein